jgi:16S rRNA (guanine527-N7)-methyltransferase
MTDSLELSEGPMLRGVYERARSIGLLGPGPVEDHIVHAGRFVRASGEEVPGRVIDLGSGAGVPGFVLALAWPDARVVLLDAMAKRVAFLQWAVEELGIGSRVDVLQGRAEELGADPSYRASFDLASARGFGPPAVTAECASGFLRTGGRLIVSEPPDGQERWPADGLALLGMQRIECGEPYIGVYVKV